MRLLSRRFSGSTGLAITSLEKIDKVQGKQAISQVVRKNGLNEWVHDEAHGRNEK